MPAPVYMKVILHIGTEKTGSTAIQNFLHHNRKRLVERGIVPGCAIDPIFGRNNLALALASVDAPGTSIQKFRQAPFTEYRERVKTIIRRMPEVLDNSSTIVFSAEHLSSQLIHEAEIESLKTLFGPEFEFEIACYLRPQHELLLGAQAEAIKGGRRNNLQFNDPRLSDPDRRYGPIYYNYDQMLILWESVFGLENIVVAPFEKETLDGADVVSDFLTRVLKTDIGLKRVGCEQPANHRLSAEALFVLAKLNERDNENATENLDLVSKLDDGSRSVLIDPKVLQAFLASFDAPNRNVALRYLGRENLFNRKSIEGDYFDLSDHHQIETALIEFFRRMVAFSLT